MLSSRRSLCGSRAATYILVALLTSNASLVNADDGRPSFDCNKAVRPSEKAICTSTTLSKMDASLGGAWRAITSAFSSGSIRKIMKAEQFDWMKRRDACGGDVNCLMEAYQDRLQNIRGGSGIPYTGVWHAENGGDLFIYRCKTGEFFAAIHTSDPQAGSWTCDVEGNASIQRDKMLLSSDGRTITITGSEKGTLSIPPSNENLDNNQYFCGLNGGFTFEYRRDSFK